MWKDAYTIILNIQKLQPWIPSYLWQNHLILAGDFTTGSRALLLVHQWLGLRKNQYMGEHVYLLILHVVNVMEVEPRRSPSLARSSGGCGARPAMCGNPRKSPTVTSEGVCNHNSPHCSPLTRNEGSNTSPTGRQLGASDTQTEPSFSFFLVKPFGSPNLFNFSRAVTSSNSNL